MRLPDEDAVRQQIEQTLDGRSRDMGRLLNLGVSVLAQRWTIGKPRGLDETVLRIVAGMFAKAWKTYRCIIILAERGFAEDAFILARSLFETALAIYWILRRASRTRAQRYVVHLAMRDRKWLRALKATRGLKHYAKVGLLRALHAEIVGLTDGLTPPPTSYLADRYSEKPIKDTAAVPRVRV